MSILRSKLLRTLVGLGLFGAAFYYTASFCDQQTDGFSVARIHSELPFDPAWETASLPSDQKEEILQILNQKFHYLGFGGQCFAFASEDGKYVIKFFKHKIRKPFSFLLQTPLPDPFEKKRLKKLNKALFKLHRDFNSYKIAFEDLREETGLLFIHLNKGSDLKQSMTIVDKIGIEHQITLDNVEFVLQKRAKLVYSYIDELMAKDDTESAKAAMRSILDVIVSRCKKGVFDEDARIHRNFGFIGSKPIFIDVGRFRRDSQRTDPEIYKTDLEDITGRFRDWLEETYPKLVPILDEELYEYQKQA